MFGNTSISTTTKTVYLPTSFSNENYMFAWSTSTQTNTNAYIYERTTTSFKTSWTNSAGGSHSYSYLLIGY